MNRKMKKIELLKEMIRRMLQIVDGIFLFDCPGLNKLRNLVYKIMFEQYGNGNLISKGVMFYVPHGLKRQKVHIADKVRISERVSIDCSSEVNIGENVWISEHSLILNHEHIIDGRKFKDSKDIKLTNGITIGEDAWIGANVTILPQVSFIGKGAIIGAGSVVTKDVSDYEIFAGNPARCIGNR